MAPPEQIADALDGLAPGVELRLRLKDGTKVAGTLVSIADGELRFEHVIGDRPTRVSADDVVDVVILIRTDPPE